MMLWILFVILIVDLALLLCVCNILLDIKEYLMYEECLNDESSLRDN